MREKSFDRLQVVILSVMDNAGVAYRMKEAVEQHGKYDVTSIQAVPHPQEFPHDLILKDSSALQLYKIQSLIYEADVIHYKGDESNWYTSRNWFNLYIPPDKPIVHSAEGTGFRTKQYPREWYNTPHKYVICHDLLDRAEDEWEYAPQPFDCDDSPYLWEMKERPIVAHSPTNRDNKGTDEILSILKELDVDIRLIENVTASKSIKMKRDATLFIDSIKLGGYGVSAQEALQFGIPTISNDGYSASGVMSTSENLKTKLELLFNNPELLKQKSLESFERVKEHHGYKATGKIWTEIYDKALSSSL